MTSRLLPLHQAFWFQEGPGVRKWQFKDDGIKLLNVSNIVTGGTLDLSKTDRHLDPEEVHQRYSHFLVDYGDFVIASSGIGFDLDGFLRTRGAFIAKEHLPLCMNTSTIRFKARAGVSDLNYLKHWINGSEFRRQITRLVTGSAQKNFGPSHLKEVAISLPSLDEQRRIAAILDKADAIRRKRQQALALADDFLRSAFLEMFGDPVTNPRGWAIDTLGEHLDYLTSGSRGWASYYDDDGQDIFIRIGNVGSNQLLMDDVQYINAPDNAEARRTRVKTGDVLLSITADLGRTAVIPANLGTAYINQHLAIIRPKGIDPLFLSQFLASRGGQTQFKQLDRAGVKSGLNFDDIRSLKIPLPPLSLQQRFAELWRRVKSASDQLGLAVQETNILFASLSQRAFRGEL